MWKGQQTMVAEQDKKESISPETRIGSVSLKVKDIDLVQPFYEQILGFEVLGKDGSHVELGVDAKNALVRLQIDPSAHRRRRGTTGLYHYAILLPKRRDLAVVLDRLLSRSYPLQGASDHHVSEAVYLADPEGNGIEIYADRPRDEWYTSDGKMRMGTVALDVDDLLSTIDQQSDLEDKLPRGTRIGHIHLHVADLDKAVTFYRDVVGFELMMLYGPSAGFLSAGGYHHHIGINTWAGEDAPEPAPGSTGLVEYSILVPDSIDLAQIAARAGATGIDIDSAETYLNVSDPSGNRLKIMVNEQI
jgi:catechol 2,3-dioxygenase